MRQAHLFWSSSQVTRLKNQGRNWVWVEVCAAWGPGARPAVQRPSSFVPSVLVHQFYLWVRVGDYACASPPSLPVKRTKKPKKQLGASSVRHMSRVTTKLYYMFKKTLLYEHPVPSKYHLLGGAPPDPAPTTVLYREIHDAIS